MRIRKAILAGALVTSGLALTACHDDRPGHWGDRHHGRHHHHDHDRYR